MGELVDVRLLLRREPGLLTAVLLLLVAPLIGMVSLRSSVLGVLLGVAVVLAAAGLHRPHVLAVVAVPALWAVQRAGPTSATDVVLAAAGLLGALALAGTPHLRVLRPLAVPFAFYLAMLVPSLIANQSPTADFEWLHRVSLVLGAAVVGVWLVVRGALTTALRLFLAVSAGLAVTTVLIAVRDGFEPVFPLGYHKNFAGSLLSLAFLLALACPRTIALPGVLRLAVLAVFASGTVATQSRGAILGAAAGALLCAFAPRGERALSPAARLAAVLLVVAFSGYAATSVAAQLSAENVETNSVGVRRDVEARTLELWRSAPVVGVGIRYFRTGEYGPLAQVSNNALNSELAESGVLGCAGFVVFHGAALVVLYRRRRTELGLAALATVSCQLLHGMVDIYWGAGVSPLPWVVSGAALAAGAGTRRRQDVETEARTPGAAPASRW